MKILGNMRSQTDFLKKIRSHFRTDELKEGMSVTEGTADQTTAAMWDDSEDDEVLMILRTRKVMAQSLK